LHNHIRTHDAHTDQVQSRGQKFAAPSGATSFRDGGSPTLDVMRHRQVIVAFVAASWVSTSLAACGGDDPAAVPTASSTVAGVTTTSTPGVASASPVSSTGATAAADPAALANAVPYEGIGWTMQIDPSWQEVSELDLPAVAEWDVDDSEEVTVERSDAPDLAAYAAVDGIAFLGFTGVQVLSQQPAAFDDGGEYWRATATAELDGTPVGITVVAIDTGDEVIAARYAAFTADYDAAAATMEQFLLTLRSSSG
jgi:predicted small lipoprotein YifL